MYPSLFLSHLIGLVCNFMNCEVRMYPQPTISPNIELENLEFNFPIVVNNDSASFKGPLPFKEEYYEPLDPPPSVHLPHLGVTIEGYTMTIIGGRKIYAFEGIPYAEPPLGDKRFRDPIPHKGWENETLEAKNPGPKCIQLANLRVTGREDCLKINIYTTKIGVDAKLPVFVNIHGGAFIFGYSFAYGPGYLLSEEDAIMVSFGYRLGIMGQFSTGDALAPGNWALKDQALAINWVHSHISPFGGDPLKLTLIGQSSGAVYAHLHLLSEPGKWAKEKIFGAISLSGNAYNVWGLNTLEGGVALSKKSARLAHCPTSQGTEVMLECMRKKDSKLLVANQLLTMGQTFPLPMIEPKVAGAFLKETPDEAYIAGHVAKVPWISTVTSQEANTAVAEIAARPGGVGLLKQIFYVDPFLPLTLRRRIPPKSRRRIGASIRKFYGIRRGQLPLAVPRKLLTEIGNGRYFTVPFHKGLQMHCQIAPTFGGIFNYTNKHGTAGQLGLSPEDYGLAHTDDLLFIFNSTKHPPLEKEGKDYAISRFLINVFKNFAEMGRPGFTGSEGRTHGFWEVIKDPLNFSLLQINEEVKMDKNPYKKISNFWESLGIFDIKPYTRI